MKKMQIKTLGSLSDSFKKTVGGWFGLIREHSRWDMLIIFGK
jgi:hypothetical protein